MYNNHHILCGRGGSELLMDVSWNCFYENTCLRPGRYSTAQHKKHDQDLVSDLVDPYLPFDPPQKKCFPLKIDRRYQADMGLLYLFIYVFDVIESEYRAKNLIRKSNMAAKITIFGHWFSSCVRICACNNGTGAAADWLALWSVLFKICSCSGWLTTSSLDPPYTVLYSISFWMTIIGHYAYYCGSVKCRWQYWALAHIGTYRLNVPDGCILPGSARIIHIVFCSAMHAEWR